MLASKAVRRVALFCKIRSNAARKVQLSKDDDADGLRQSGLFVSSQLLLVDNTSTSGDSLQGGSPMRKESAVVEVLEGNTAAVAASLCCKLRFALG